MSKAKALRALKRERMQAQNGYTWHLLDVYIAHGGDLPGGETYYSRMARRAQYRKELVRP
jgi:hypothetical protein